MKTVRPFLYEFIIPILTVLILVTGCSGGDSNSSTDSTPTWTWVQLIPSSPPAARYGHAMVYATGPFIFGGKNRSSKQTLQDTWEWDGSRWLEYTPAYKPPSRLGHAMAYDEEHQQVVLFGGARDWGDDGDPVGAMSDTWIWDGFSWNNVTPVEVNPAPRWLHTLAYDPNRKKVVLHGGHAAGGIWYNDTWEWDGTRWTQVPTPAGYTVPARRFNHAMVYDHFYKSTLVFGGLSAVSGNETNDMLWWDGQSWGQAVRGLEPTSLPPARVAHAMAADSALKRIVLFGGATNGAQSLLNDTWIWEWPQGWTQAHPSVSPPARAHHAMAYNWATQEVFLFGGRDSGDFGDTWVYRRRDTHQ